MASTMDETLPPIPDFINVDYAKYHSIGYQEWSITWTEKNSESPGTSSLLMAPDSRFESICSQVLSFHSPLIVEEPHENILPVVAVYKLNLSVVDVNQIKKLVAKSLVKDGFKKSALPAKNEKVDSSLYTTVLFLKVEECTATLFDWLDEYNHPGRDFYAEPTRAYELCKMQVSIAEGLLEGLRFLHSQGLIHGELCADNIVFCGGDNDKYRQPIKICRRLYPEVNYFMMEYIPPECDGSQHTIGCDAYAAGVIFSKVIYLEGRSDDRFKMTSNEEHQLVTNARDIICQLTQADAEKRFLDKVQLKIRKANKVVENKLSSGVEKLKILLNDKDGTEWFGGLTLDEVLGTGGFGTVFLAHDHDGKASAVKIILQYRPGSSCSLAFPEDYEPEDEFESAKDTNHVNLVKLYQFRKRMVDVAQLQGMFRHKKEFVKVLECLGDVQEGEAELIYMEMELCGFSLRNWTNNLEIRNASGPLFQLKILLGIKEGLAYLHGKGILHRDLKPENIFFSHKYTLPIKIGDFGLARELQQSYEKDAGLYFLTEKQGTPSYRAPEVEDGLYGFGADLYSFGLVVWEVVQFIPNDERESFVNRLVHNVETGIVNQHPFFTDIKDTIVQLTLRDPKTRLSDINRVKFHVGRKDVHLFAEDSEDFCALFQAAAPGSVICLRSKLYSGKFEVPHDVSLQGSKDGGTFIVPNGVDKSSFLSLSTGCRLQDVTLKGLGIFLNGSGCTVEGVKVIDVRNCGLRMVGNVNHVVRCKFVNCFVGIMVSGSENSFQNLVAEKTSTGVIFSFGCGNSLDGFVCEQSDCALAVSGEAVRIDNVTINSKIEGDKPAIFFLQAVNCSLSNFECEGRIEIGHSSNNNVIKDGKCESISISEDSEGCIICDVQTSKVP